MHSVVCAGVCPWHGWTSECCHTCLDITKYVTFHETVRELRVTSHTLSIDSVLCEHTPVHRSIIELILTEGRVGLSRYFYCGGGDCLEFTGNTYTFLSGIKSYLTRYKVGSGSVY